MIASGSRQTTAGVTSANFSSYSLSVGSHSITASYADDSNFNPSTSSAVTQVVSKADTTTSLASSVNPTRSGQSTTFTAIGSVESPGRTAGGHPIIKVTFYDGSTSIGSGSLSTSGGVTTATFSTSTLSTSSHSMTATYSNDTNFNGSTSAAVSQVVNKADTTTLLSSAVNPSVSGQSVTLTAAVSVNAPGSTAVANPTGTVNFFDGSTSIGSGTLNTSSGGVTTASFATNTLSVGSHSITAGYADDSNFNPSTSTAVTQSVLKADTTTSVSSSANPSLSGQPVTFTATVTVNSPGSTAVAYPTGTVNFHDGTS